MNPTIVDMSTNKKTKQKIKISNETKIRILEDKVKRLEAYLYRYEKERWLQHMSEDNRS